MSRIVIAFGGNALGNNPKEQQSLIKKAIKNIIPLVIMVKWVKSKI